MLVIDFQTTHTSRQATVAKTGGMCTCMATLIVLLCLHTLGLSSCCYAHTQKHNELAER